MKKLLQINLKELAISILRNNSETSTTELKEQAAALYESLSVLSYLENNESAIPESPETDVIPKTTEKPIQINHEITLAEPEPTEIKKETSLDSSIKFEKPNPTPAKPKTDTTTPNQNSPGLLFELDELTEGFKNMPEFERVQPSEGTNKQKTNINKATINSNVSTSLNESLKKGINIGLNDRLAFVKHLFDNNQDDYTRVISQLNTLQSASDAKNFIEQMVKPEYNNWESKETYEERFLNIVFSKFDN